MRVATWGSGEVGSGKWEVGDWVPAHKLVLPFVNATASRLDLAGPMQLWPTCGRNCNRYWVLVLGIKAGGGGWWVMNA